MKASICTKYGGPEVLLVKEVKKPTPKEKELLIKIMASSVTAADAFMREGTPFYGRLFLGFTKPKNPITGTGFSGKVVGIGSEVSNFKIGDSICGESIFGAGTNAEYTVVSEDGNIIAKPNNISDAEAACICDGPLTSLSMLKDIGQLKPGESILVNGASGSLGTAAVEIAKYLGAHVTGVCSEKNIELVKKLGADEVIDYTKSDFTEGQKKYDMIYDSVGKSSFQKSRKALSHQGVYVCPVLSTSLLFQVMITALFGKKKAKFSATGLRPTAELLPLLLEIKTMMETGKLMAMIDQTFPLEKISTAHSYVATGRKKGNVVIAH